MSNTAQKIPRQMHCTCCGLTKPRKGAKLIGGTYACAECVPDLLPALPKPKGRPPAESREPYRGYALQPKPNEPAQPAEGDSVTRAPVRRGRYEVDPAEVSAMFSALGVGHYQRGGWAERYLEGKQA